jgi:hypothetical protein
MTTSATAAPATGPQPSSARNSAPVAAAMAEADTNLLDALLFSLILLAWAVALWCWVSHYPTSLI